MNGSENQSAITAFLAGVLIGAVVGAGTALLLAPQSGSRTRLKLRHAAEDLGGRAEETLEHAAEDARRMAGDARRAAERSGSRAKKKAKRKRDELT